MDKRGAKGFTYLGVLILVAALGAVLGAAGTRWATVDQRNREAELLRIGAEVRSAIGAYYESSPGTVKNYPPNLEALLRDSRYLGIRRYLRRIPRDPMTRQSNWGLVASPDGGVRGLYSSSDKIPFRTNFLRSDTSSASAALYSDWKFVYVPVIPTAPAGIRPQE
jgi:type II secretory pathway pseudopilin PulG